MSTRCRGQIPSSAPIGTLDGLERLWSTAGERSRSPHRGCSHWPHRGLPRHLVRRGSRRPPHRGLPRRPGRRGSRRLHLRARPRHLVRRGWLRPPHRGLRRLPVRRGSRRQHLRARPCRREPRVAAEAAQRIPSRSGRSSRADHRQGSSWARQRLREPRKSRRPPHQREARATFSSG